MSLTSIIVLFSAGAAAGMFGSMLGLGGGILLTPFLVLVLHVPMHQAIAASITVVIATSSAGAALNVERQTVHIRLAMLLEITTVVGAIGGGLTASALKGDTLTRIFAIVLLVIAVMMALGERWKRLFPSKPSGKQQLPAEFYDDGTRSLVPYSVRNIPGTMIVSFFAGNISGLLGLGGGIFKVPAMHLLSGVPIKAATATSNFMIGVTAAAGAFIYFSEGHLNPVIAGPAVLGVMAGSFLGVHASRRMNAGTIRWIFVFVLLFASVQLFLR